jgi:hypothetical protein
VLPVSVAFHFAVPELLVCLILAPALMDSLEAGLEPQDDPIRMLVRPDFRRAGRVLLAIQKLTSACEGVRAADLVSASWASQIEALAFLGTLFSILESMGSRAWEQVFAASEAVAQTRKAFHFPIALVYMVRRLLAWESMG